MYDHSDSFLIQVELGQAKRSIPQINHIVIIIEPQTQLLNEHLRVFILIQHPQNILGKALKSLLRQCCPIHRLIGIRQPTNRFRQHIINKLRILLIDLGKEQLG
jgi:hypothetical protein